MIDPLVPWAAGFFDGEGCVLIVVLSTGTHRLGIDVGQVKREPLDLLAERWGGKVQVAHGAEYRQGRQRFYKWRLHGHAAVAFLRDIRPFLIVKAAAADLAIEYEPTLLGRGRHGGVYRLTPETRAKRAELQARLHVLNARGAKSA